MTRSGRCYTLEVLVQAEKGKGKELAGTRKLENRKEQSESDMTGQGSGSKEPVSDKEVTEFLKFIKHSEYSIVEQLNHMPAKISMLSLIMNSEPHQKALLKVLRQSYVPQDISVESVDDLVGNIAISNFISFNDEEIPPEGRGSVKALHISIDCKSHRIAKVLIDNGSSLNVMPMSTLNQLPIDSSYMQKSHLVVRAFDGSRRPVVGNIEIPIEVGSIPFNVQFQVMDIKPSYSCLLGRPWLHMAGAVPSSLHQKVKFIVGNNLVTVKGEEDIMVTRPSSAPYVEAAEEAIDCSFGSFEFVNAMYAAEGSKVHAPRLSKSTEMAAKQMMEKGYRVGLGLGKSLQGIKRPVVLKKNQERFGLGYVPTKKDIVDRMTEKRRNRIANFKGAVAEVGKLFIPHLNDTFRSGGYIYPEGMLKEEAGIISSFSDLSVQTIEKEEEDEERQWVYPKVPGAETNNWEIKKLPVVFKFLKK